MPAILRICERDHPFPLLSCKGHWIMSLVHLCCQGGDKFQSHWCSPIPKYGEERVSKALHPLYPLHPPPHTRGSKPAAQQSAHQANTNVLTRDESCSKAFNTQPRPACTPGVCSPQRRSPRLELDSGARNGVKRQPPGDLSHLPQKVREGCWHDVLHCPCWLGEA